MSPFPISFTFIDTSFDIRSKAALRNWINTVVLSEKLNLGPISYIFCSDKYLHKMNVKYLNHDTFTDIISFDYSESEMISGDLFISYERVKENAKLFSVPVKEELHRVMIHGVLHLCGYQDKSNDQKEEMRKKENFYLAML